MDTRQWRTICRTMRECMKPRAARRFSSRISWIARVNEVILPIARRLLREDQSGRASGNGYLAATLAHEISHELGPNYSRIAGSKKDIREAIGGDFSALEEAKADVVGLFCLKWLA